MGRINAIRRLPPPRAAKTLRNSGYAQFTTRCSGKSILGRVRSETAYSHHFHLRRKNFFLGSSLSTAVTNMAPAADSTTRFSSRVDDYVNYRPSYPAALAELLSTYFSLPHHATIVDVGSGTGILTKVLLEELKDKQVTIIGVEPNKEMREASDTFLAPYVSAGRFKSIDGTAEKMGELADGSIDLIVAAQAFHWFDVPKARLECQRVLKKPDKLSTSSSPPSGASSGVALIWNERRGVQHEQRESQPPEWDFRNLDLPVMTAYDLMLVRHASEYPEVSVQRSTDEASMEAFFGPAGFASRSFPNPYQYNYKQLKGRLLSSSYTPQQGQPGHEELIADLDKIYQNYEKNGLVDFLYETRVFLGPISS